MDRIRSSVQGLKEFFTNIVNAEEGENDPSVSSISSGEEVPCDSDCSKCATENRSISLVPSGDSSKRSIANVNQIQQEIEGEPSRKKLKKNNDQSNQDEIELDAKRISEESKKINELAQEINKDQLKSKNTQVAKQLNKSNTKFPQTLSLSSSAKRISSNNQVLSKPKRKYHELQWESDQKELGKNLASQGNDRRQSQAVSVNPFQVQQDNQQEVKKLSNSFEKIDLKDIDRKIQQKNKIIQVATRRKTELINDNNNSKSHGKQFVTILTEPKQQRPVFSLEDLKVSKMLIEKTMEIISEFHTVKINTQPLDSSYVIVRDPESFKLSKSQFEINQCYLELIEKSLKQNGGYFPNDVVIDNEQANYRITKKSLELLQPGKWLNDEIVNSYVSLINLREQRLNIGNVFAFNTYFYTMIEQMLKRGDYDYRKLERVLKRKKVNLKNYKMIIVPINIERYHWFILAVNLVEDKFQIVDSMKSNHDTTQEYVNNFKKFFQDYLHANKGGRTKCEDNLQLWNTEVPKSIPNQGNGYDCGMCTSINMEILSRYPKVSEIKYKMNSKFSEENRKRMSVELMFGQLLTEMPNEQQS